MVFLASSRRPFRTCHHGDSGAKMVPMRIGSGHIPGHVSEQHAVLTSLLTLQSKGNSIRPLTIPVEDTTEDTRSDELTDDPAKVDVGRQVGSKRNRGYFCSIGRRKSLEDAPGDPDGVLALLQGLMPFTHPWRISPTNSV